MKSSDLEPFGERGKVIMHQALVNCRFPTHFYVPSHNLTLIKSKHCCIASISILLGDCFLLILCYQFTWKRSQTLFLWITCLFFFMITCLNCVMILPETVNWVKKSLDFLLLYSSQRNQLYYYSSADLKVMSPPETPCSGKLNYFWQGFICASTVHWAVIEGICRFSYFFQHRWGNDSPSHLCISEIHE